MCEYQFNPLEEEEKKIVVLRIMEAFEKCSGHQLPLTKSFPGAGVYALYYFGPFDLYSFLVHKNAGGQLKVPIYVGKANLRGGSTGIGKSTRQTPLYNRLKEHAESIQEARNLALQDFKCKYLILDQVWVRLGEEILLRQFKPLWNSVVQGFGIHTPGKGRANQRRSEWDTLHPGRNWVESLNLPPNKMTEEQIRNKVRKHFMLC